jgi:hypothetical protein
VSRAEVAEIGFTAFASRPAAEQVTGRLVVRRIPDLNPAAGAGQQPLFDSWRFHTFFTTSDLDTVTADRVHRGHAIIEQVHADLKHSALAHLPSGKFAANSAWLVCAVMTFNLTRAAAVLAGAKLAKATTPTIGARWSPSPPESPPRPAASPCTYPPDGPGKTPGPSSSPTPADHPQRQPPDPQPATAQPGRPVEHPRSEAGHTPAPAVGKHPDHRHNSVHQDHR